MTATDQVFDILRRVTTATITTMLLKKGIRRCWLAGPKPLVPGATSAGLASNVWNARH